MKAFISYSHQDSDILQKLLRHLSVLRREKMVHAWTDHMVHAGEVIDQRIKEAMDEAELFLLLVSASFIHSEYCFETEFARALERHAAGSVTIVPIIVRECDWKIAQLRQFKALPTDGVAVLSRHWHSEDEAFTDVIGGIRRLLESKATKPRKANASEPAKNKFTPDDSHISPEQREELRKIHAEVVERLTVKMEVLPDEERKKKRGKFFGIVWSQFNKKHEIEEHGLHSLPKDKFQDARKWLLGYRGSTDKNFKSVNPQKYRNTLTKGIYTRVGQLGWSKEELYRFSLEKLTLKAPITSLNDLGDSQLKHLSDQIKYQLVKTTRKTRTTPRKASRRKPPGETPPST